MPTIKAQVNGGDAAFVADSGAFYSLITPDAAARFRLRPMHLPLGYAIHGVTGTAETRAGVADTFTIAGSTLKRTEFLVAGDGFRGIDGFLGQNVFGAFDTEFDLAHGVIRLFRSEGCRDNFLGYWGKDVAISAVRIAPQTPLDADIAAEAQVNGQRIRVIFDSGAGHSGLKLSTARRIGLKLDDPAVLPGGVVRGIGLRETATWIVPIQSFGIGDETIQNTRLRVAREELPGADMLLGVDFFLSHRVLVVPEQRKLYFSYNGGPVFRLDQAAARPPSAPPPPAKMTPRS